VAAEKTPRALQAPLRLQGAQLKLGAGGNQARHYGR